MDGKSMVSDIWIGGVDQVNHDGRAWGPARAAIAAASSLTLLFNWVTARDIAARPVKPGDQAEPNWITASITKTIGMVRGRCLGQQLHLEYRA